MESDNGSGTASNFIWAVTLLLIVLIISAVAYFGIKQMNRSTRHEIDVNISAPSR